MGPAANPTAPSTAPPGGTMGHGGETTGTAQGAAGWPGAAAVAAKAAGFALWAGLFLLPLAVLAFWPDSGGAPGGDTADGTAAAAKVDWSVWADSLLTAAGIAAASVVLGILPGRLLAAAAGLSRRSHLLALLAMLAPLLLPPHVLYYAWTLLLAPTSWLGSALSGRPQVARAIGSAAGVMVMVTWYWPLAALVLSQGWRSIDRSVADQAVLDAGPFQRTLRVTLPLLGPSMLLAFAVCGLAAMAEFTTFHLSGLRTVGTELYALYEQTCSEQAVARAGWPVLLPALPAAWALWRAFGRPRPDDALAGEEHPRRPAGPELAAAALLLLLSLGLPLVLLGVYLEEWAAVQRYWAIHREQLGTSWLVSLAGAGLSLAMAGLGVNLRSRWLGGLVRLSLLAFLFLPAPFVASALLRAMSSLGAPDWLRLDWPAVSLGLTMRFAGLALVVLLLVRHGRRRALADLAAVDGATPVQAWRHVHLPLLWPAAAGAVMVCAMLGVTEVAATMVLLPPGLPSFSRDLLNQMHYARDQDVIVSCLALVGCYLVAGAALAALLVRPKEAAVVEARRDGTGGSAASGSCRAILPFSAAFAFGLASVFLGGCDRTDSSGADRPPDVVRIIGKTGSGPAEFLYPRAIDSAGDGTLFVVDKTGRVQHLTAEGRMIEMFRMPLIDAGKPVGLSAGPDGNVWIADTHYNRVTVYTPAGELVAQFGTPGRGQGEFIYPTDIAFVGPAGPDGRVLVSEYGGNDRVNVFAWGEGYRMTWLRQVGSFGSDEGQFSRPAAMAVDAARNRLYVADACNHRLAVYDVSGGVERLVGYAGAVGAEKGQMRYPYGLALGPGGELAVCEYGNNRLQFWRPSGLLLESVALMGQAGRHGGQLAYPWAVTFARGHVVVVDAGNNRLQVWRR